MNWAMFLNFEARLALDYPEGVESLQPRVGRRRPTLGNGNEQIIFNPEGVADTEMFVRSVRAHRTEADAFVVGALLSAVFSCAEERGSRTPLLQAHTSTLTARTANQGFNPFRVDDDFFRAITLGRLADSPTQGWRPPTPLGCKCDPDFGTRFDVNSSVCSVFPRWRDSEGSVVSISGLQKIVCNFRPASSW